jgi:hypothetical protein
MKIRLFLLLTILVIWIFSQFIFQPPKNETNIKVDNNTIRKELTASDIYQNSKNGIAIVFAYDENGIPLSQGTGFFIESNKLVTNFHVIENSKSIRVKLIDSEKFLKKSEVKLSSEKYDLAIVETEIINNHLPLDTISEPKIGSKIFTIGNPRGLTGTISEGIISAKRKNDYDLIQITAPISPGNSGGPLINEKGKVIGISTFTMKNSQNLNFAIPLKYISNCKKHIYDKVNERTKITEKKGAVTISIFKKRWLQEVEYISFKNNTKDFINHITGVLIYKDMEDNIIDYRVIDEKIVIPPNLAKRISIESFDNEGSYYYYKDESGDHNSEKFKIEFRLLSYEIEE